MYLFLEGGILLKKKRLLKVLSTSFIAASLLAVPTPELALGKAVPKESAVYAIESTKLLNHQGQEVKIVRDSFGVPHIYSETDSALFFGAGYATAEDRLWQAELSRLVASGRMAEAFGGTPANIGQDQVIRRDGYTDEEALAQFASLPEYVKRGLQGYIDGINHYIETTPATLLPPEFRGQKPAKWTIVDSLKVQQLMVRRFGESGGGEMSKLTLLQNLQTTLGAVEGLQAFETVYMKNDPTAQVSLDTTTDKSVKKASKIDTTKFPNSTKVAKQLEQEQQMKLDIEKTYGFPSKGGSNAWVVSPSRSATGGTLLLGGPQMGFSVPQIAHEVGIHGAGYNSVGMAFAGAGPIPLIGRGNDFAWTTTTGYGDQVDTFVLTINPANPNQYLHNGKWVDFEVRTEKIKVAGGNSVDFKVYRSVHGPVVHKDSQTAYAQQRSHWGKEVEAMVAFYDFNRASNIKQFEEATEKIPTSHNFLYADKQGNIGYWITGRNAIRAEGADNRLPMAGDGSQEWQGIASTDSLPHAINPSQGVVANWNNKPSPDWEYTEQAFGPTHRSGFILDQLAALDKVTWEDMEQINKKAGHVHLDAYFFKDLLLSQINQDLLSDDVKLAAELIAEWDMYQWDDNKDELYDHPGLTIFKRWLANVKETALAQLEDTGGDSTDLLFHVLTSNEEDLAAKYGFLGELDLNQIAAESLQAAVTELAAKNPDKSMQEWLTPISRINFQVLGAAGVEPILNMNRGTYNQIVEFSKASTKSVNILPPGQSGNPLSSHFDDQRLLYANWEYKPMILDILKPNKK
jgi:penicillin G amidase